MTRGARWTARVCGTLGVLFLLFDTGIHIANIQPVIDSSVQLGLPVDLMPALGILQVVLLALYLLPRTSVLGAVLWTGYLGGAILTNLRVGNPMLTHVLFPVYIALLLWIPLYLREPRLRALLPLRHEA